MMSVPPQFFRGSKSKLDVYDIELHVRSWKWYQLGVHENLHENLCENLRDNCVKKKSSKTGGFA